jgi:glycolate oxidase iron-sulfur subunit
MQTKLDKTLLSKADAEQAEQILRSCVHCGFCTATCPTYQLLGDELDGPRGRIYQIKQVLEGDAPTENTLKHLDRCLLCRACETTCPSGVRYGELLEIGRHAVEKSVQRPLLENLLRWLLEKTIPYPARFGVLFKLGQIFRFMLPASLKQHIPEVEAEHQWSQFESEKKLLVLEGCAQSVTSPDTNAIASKVFERLGYQLVRENRAGCCGAVSTHLSQPENGKQFMRNNINAWWPHIEAGVEAIMVTASGCGLMVKEYGSALSDDPVYAEKASKIASLCFDPIELLLKMDFSSLDINTNVGKVAFHAPCTLQHGMKQLGKVESLLTRLGFDLLEVRDGHLCCGSSGTYSLLQPELSEQLRDNKLQALKENQPDIIVTANIGCQMHLQSGVDKPVRHWLSLLLS